MKKKNVLVLITLLTALLLNACAFAEAVELSDEDSQRVADYSSDILSQHNQYSNSKLVPVEVARQEYQKQVDLEAKKKNFVAMQQALNGEAAQSDGSGNGQGETESGNSIPVPEISLAEAIDIPEFDVQYTGYETVVSYPENTVSDDFVMGMTAAQGDILLVVHFSVTNTADYEQECDVLSAKPQFRVRVNGERKTLQQTILANDLSKLSTTLQPGETADTVLISEMAQGDAASIESLSLIVRSAQGRPEYVLEE